MDPVLNHYKELYAKHGNSPHSVQYSDQKTQYKRFEVLTEVAPSYNSITDFGCGLADLYIYLKKHKGFNGQYLGLDFVPDFIKTNKIEFANNNQVDFEIFNLREDQLRIHHEYGILSGVFNNLMDDNESFMLEGIRKMFNSCSKGIAFNAMSTYVDYQDKNLYYSDPLKVFDFCKRELSKKVVLRHDFETKENIIPFEYCIYVYK